MTNDNVTGIDYGDRQHFVYSGPIIDFHAHVMATRPGDPPTGPPLGKGPGASLAQAELMLETGYSYGVVHTVTMCPLEDVAILMDRFGDQLTFNAMLNKAKPDDPDDEVFRTLDHFIEQGAKLVKLWSAPRGRDRGLVIDAPWRIQGVRRARAAGIRMVMVHVGDPDVWFQGMYADAAKYGTKPDQYVGLRKMLELFPDMIWIGAHMGGDVEHPDHLEALMEKYPHLYLDTSATKWQIREASPRRQAVRALVCRFPERILFGTDLVTRQMLNREHYESRYWCQRTLWETAWEGQSPIADPDYQATPTGPATPLLQGVDLPADVLDAVYYLNARRLLDLPVI